MTFQIVFQHPDFIVINKPTGISVHKDDADIGLTRLVAQQLGVPQVWLVHRLDKVTSGLLMLALNEQAAVTLSQKFAHHQIQKTYLALATHNPKKKQGRISGDMQKARRGAWKLTQSKENPAVTDFVSHSLAPNLRLFILRPKTGKTHQLRVAMKSLGSPILGDALYGGDSAERAYLHAYQLSFDYFGQAVQIKGAPLKDEKCGDFFQRFWADIEKYVNADAEKTP
ncbi:TIGR01621 family pseudouridine synthase [Aggregatibacter actinomycetemcomitans]|uniref:TIGR01621 family pseudouridine synthase n=1 Tax=Aggregatibacter actinomycetemcomitans TaxID=714 RepID=UPI00023FF45A|nr:TIGR01621 family pseudouridine synthase [Aggregatibacter actinomycetemcomitans]EHK91162.1 pseudouridine synthase Rlu family protein [Aggregatibacter actinomycetemcomitans RhAA1]KNE78194.1 pseudouridine synthase [Aggregatibacter actinomycetemcomitans RhAA1]